MSTLWQRLYVTKPERWKTCFIILAALSQGLYNKELLQSECVWMFGESGAFFSISWRTWALTPVDSLGKHGCQSIASLTPPNHNPSILSAACSPERASRSVRVCVWERETWSIATIVYPHILNLSPANFSHVRSPHKLDSHRASC